MGNQVIVTLPDQRKLEVEQSTTLYQVAQQIGSSFAKKAAVASIDGELHDLNHQIEKDCQVEFFTYEDEEGLAAIRYTLSYLVGEAAVKYGVEVADFGVNKEQFYCDFKAENTLKAADLKEVTKTINKAISANHPIEVHEYSKLDALDLFKDNPFMQHHIEQGEEPVKVAVHGDYKAVIHQPLVTNLSKVKNYKLQSISATNWLRDVNNESLQRIAGFAFADAKALEEHQAFIEKYEQVNHRRLGKELDIFSFSEYAPGMPFYAHNGQVIRLELQNMLRQLQFEADYEEVYTPFIMDETLWKNSGHWDHYQDNMYFTEVDEQTYALKPMNCPGHMLIYKNHLHSYRDLPIRMAEFGQVHRHELSGSLNGLFRVRTFNQDDAHIFVRRDQIESEILDVLGLIHKVYSVFGFDYSIELSTRPDDFMGEIELWDFAEQSLENMLNQHGFKYTVNEKDGAFYGPKIDIHIKDALGRSHQCGTVQLDFQMPEKFDLTFINQAGEKERPVVIHRAIYGSSDRFIGILLEHFGGNLPLWLAPVQMEVILVNADLHLDAVKDLKRRLKKEGFRVELDLSDEKMGYKIRQAHLKKVPYTLVVGDNEVENGTVAVRKRGESEEHSINVEDFVKQLKEEVDVLDKVK
ncbi:threonine--tRNA ligase [Staphylococcus carnosus]|uniref:Threonine--tRNA ligase n=1 Tax=Staphylococcus carnosus (strain TM300) TaxID=396513 RepID=B9DKB7_STACT|nr:threonine--tRNA ligase [Staphylococcus carnosus]QPT03381.1 threonine--tRNA ligase [Staphylococcus carnosus]UQA68386.1 threonine--tRNA ligase [Staphylococcus carnosus]UTB79058.1 threonine--tRNA ligase [Staphylococcus carnosus]UTB88612.1 threonine--tRNA ligase [Staphylococcus carnosus]UTB90960.1 threonine--tRNA ligase [Staphylococcus carnosus]